MCYSDQESEHTAADGRFSFKCVKSYWKYFVGKEQLEVFFKMFHYFLFLDLQNNDNTSVAGNIL